MESRPLISVGLISAAGSADMDVVPDAVGSLMAIVICTENGSL